jgi:hypothetical protein
VLLKEVSLGGCVDSATIPVLVNQFPISNITGNLFVCPGKIGRYRTILLPDTKYKWSVTGGHIIGDPTLDSTIVQFPLNGKNAEIVVEETSQAGCVNHDTAHVTLYKLPSASFKSADDGKGTYVFSTIDSTVLSLGTWIVDGAFSNGFTAKHSFLHAGSFHVNFIAHSLEGCETSLDSLFTPQNTGIDLESPSAYSLKIYPNPFVGTSVISYNLKKSAQVYISICDMLGREILVLENKAMTQGNHETVLNGVLAHLPKGTYLLKFTANNSTEVKRLVNFGE